MNCSCVSLLLSSQGLEFDTVVLAYDFKNDPVSNNNISLSKKKQEEVSQSGGEIGEQLEDFACKLAIRTITQTHKKKTRQRRALSLRWSHLVRGFSNFCQSP